MTNECLLVTFPVCIVVDWSLILTEVNCEGELESPVLSQIELKVTSRSNWAKMADTVLQSLVFLIIYAMSEIYSELNC